MKRLQLDGRRFGRLTVMDSFKYQMMLVQGTFAHSVKNPDIKHYFLRRSYRTAGIRDCGEHRWISYLCQQACSTTPSKRTRNVYEVTCRNCLRELRKRGFLS